jgi:hypothetical protein
MAEPEMQMVDSSNVEAVGYDPEERVLYVRFLSGDTYIYSNVDETTYAELLSAPSVGSYLNRAIKGTFDYRKL